MADTFFSQTCCDRCNESLRVRKTSWFTEETIGLKCIAEEDALKNTMRLVGLNPDEYKGIGKEGYAKLKNDISKLRANLQPQIA